MNNFGDYEEPVSRAFWASDDFGDESTADPTFTLEWANEPCSSIKTLVVVAGKIVTDILSKCVLSNAKKICMVNSKAEFNVAALYRLSNDVCVFSVSPSINLSSAGKFIESISEVISKSEKIIALTNEMMSRLNGLDHESVNGPTLWRSLSNSKGTADRLSSVSSLKHPNFIVGAAAGVVGYAQLLEIPATVYILYVAEDAYDAETMEETMSLFTKVTNSAMPKMDTIAKTFNNDKLKLYI